MLTVTYSLIAVAAEHDNARSLLYRLQHYMQKTWNGLPDIDCAFLQSICNKLLQFDKYCRARKLEMYLIPSIRNTRKEVDELIAELESISAAGERILCRACEHLAETADTGGTKLKGICYLMGLYCEHLFARLKKEEEELFPMMRRLLSVDEWFAIAAKFLSHDAHGFRRKPVPPMLLPRSVSVAQDSVASAC